MDFFVLNYSVMSHVARRRTTFFLDLWENGINSVIFRFLSTKKLFWLIEICIIRTGDHSLINNKTCFQKKFPKKRFFDLTSHRNPLRKKYRTFVGDWQYTLINCESRDESGCTYINEGCRKGPVSDFRDDPLEPPVELGPKKTDGILKIRGWPGEGKGVVAVRSTFSRSGPRLEKRIRS